MSTIVRSLCIEVPGLPPAKSEARSLLGPRHPHAGRVLALLCAAQDALVAQGDGRGFGRAALAMAVELRAPSPPPSDATNYLGGIGDVLGNKANRGAMAHLGVYAGVTVFDNDRQLHLVRFRYAWDTETVYRVRLRPLPYAPAPLRRDRAA
jgi:hypothetical protein